MKGATVEVGLEEREQLRDVPHGELRAVAKRLGRGYNACVEQRRKHGLARDWPNWRPEEDAFIDAAIAAGVPVAAAARLLGRCETRARRRLRERRGERA